MAPEDCRKPPLRVLGGVLLAGSIWALFWLPGPISRWLGISVRVVGFCVTLFLTVPGLLAGSLLVEAERVGRDGGAS